MDAKAIISRILMLSSFDPSSSSYLNFMKMAIRKGRIISNNKLPKVKINAHLKFDVKSFLYEL